jgi:hypothetical protein
MIENPIISNYTRSENGETGEVEVLTGDENDTAIIAGIGLAEPRSDNPTLALGWRYGSGVIELHFNPFPQTAFLIVALAVNSDHEFSISETALGPLPGLKFQIQERRQPEIVRR